MHERADNGWRRLAAGAVDYGIVVAYLAVLTLVGVLLRAAGLLPDPSRLRAAASSPSSS